ncbi:MAG: sulfite exporter TauE/SafE family protein [Methylovulum sp.]|nr:MAG: sulfite exporter TauE/SafE family protein [Methylovulum sp.]
MVDIFLASLVLGLAAGLLAGLFGIGGGLVIVPALAVLFVVQGFPGDAALLMAVATSLATIIMTAVSSVLAHHRLGAVLWAKVFRLSPMIMVGAAIGAVVAKHITADALRYVLVVFLFYAGTLMALQVKPKPGAGKQAAWMDFSVAAMIGVLSSIVGIGGGTLTVPYLVHGRMPMRNAVAVSGACGLPIAIAGTASYALLGWDAVDLPEWSLGYVYLPAFAGIALSSIFTAPLGAKLANKLPAAKLKRYFSLLLFVMAVKLLWH